MFAPTSPLIAGPGREERVVARRRAVRVESEDDAGEVRIVGLRSAELIVRDSRPERAVDEVLELSAASVVADDDVELPVRPEAKDAAVVVPAQGLASVGLESTEPDEVAVERQSRAVPDEAVDSIAEQRHIGKLTAVRGGAAFRPIQIHAAVDEELRVERDAEQPPL
jgi:hypothetical protein